MEDTKKITVEKDEFSEWFIQMILKADLTDYTDVSGCLVFKPSAYAMWEKIKEEINKEFKKLEIKNVYFPLLIPEKLLKKEQKHLKGFAPEVAWVTHTGNNKLKERLAIRPTSEALMYKSYSKWIRSYKDLPLKLNQWNNVIRWEFKHPIPFLRTREFLWNEGHTVYATKEQAEKEEKQIIKIYKDFCENYLALPSLIGRKSKKETFPGAEYTTSMEFYMPNGKSIQGPDFHFDGQNFSKVYGIRFLDENENEKYAYQNTFAITTRILGIMFAIHSDKKGLILPPKMAQNKIVIIPIFSKKNEKQIIKKSQEIFEELKEFSPIIDKRKDYRPGFKFNEYELKGIPLRIEIGEKELIKKQVTLTQRNNNKKHSIKISELKKKIPKILEEMQLSLLKKAKKLLNANIERANKLNETIRLIKNKKIVIAPLCDSEKCEEILKYKSQGAKVLNISKEKIIENTKCIICNKKAKYFARIGKSY